MHIPEGLLDLPILVVLWVITIVYGTYSLWKIKKNVRDDQIAMISVVTAMVFAFQMLNFPITAGTSGHFLGFILMAILFSPSTSFIMITAILTIQAFIFADGGILALGANAFNMGIATLPGYLVFKLIRQKKNNKKSTEVSNTDKNLLIASFVGAYVSVIIASLMCGIEIGISTNFPFGIRYTIPAMVIYHAIIGIGEGFLTMMIVAFFYKYVPEYLSNVKINKKKVEINNE